MKVVTERIIKATDLNFKGYEIGRFTIVSLTTPFGLEGVGIARRSNSDKENKKKAKEISYGRALKAIVKKLNKQPIQDVLMG